MSATETKELVLSSDFDELEKLESYVDTLRDWAEIKEDDYARILLTLSEAATNAILHGNKEDPSKNVTIRSERDDRELIITVADEGEGFSPEDLPDPLKEENLLKEGGRGVYLIEEYADRVEFLDRGTTLQMTFHLNSTG